VPTVKTAFNKTLKKTIVVDGRGWTVYLYTDDTGGKPTCIARLDPLCPVLFPAVRSAGAAIAGKRIVPARLGLTRGAGGAPQVTYNRSPLYFYANDGKPGDVAGQDYYGLFYALSPKGTSIRR